MSRRYKLILIESADGAARSRGPIMTLTSQTTLPGRKFLLQYFKIDFLGNFLIEIVLVNTVLKTGSCILQSINF